MLLIGCTDTFMISWVADFTVYIRTIASYCLRHLFWFPFFGFFSMKSCTDPLNLNISQ